MNEYHGTSIDEWMKKEAEETSRRRMERMEREAAS